MAETRIVVIGAAGEMCRIAIERFAAHHSGWSLDLYDLNEDGLRELAAELPPGRTRTGRVDLFNPVALREVIRGASLVILGAGPYIRTAHPVMQACIEAGVNYLDFDDDVESTQAAIELDAAAREAGIACFVGCGASPGMTNVMAADAAAQLDVVHTLDVCWCTGDEGPHSYGAAVIEHLLHIAAGECVTWRDGQAATTPSFRDSGMFSMGGGLGDVRLYECAHPEAVTLPRRFPEARSIRVMGGLDPQPVNGIARGIAQAVLAEKMSVAEAVAWFQEVMQDKNGSLKGWRYALRGMLGQVRRRENSLPGTARFLWAAARKQHPPFRGGLLAVATGVKDGETTCVTRRSPLSGAGTYLWSSMGAVTGTATAAFTSLALDDTGRRGVLFPEDWVNPQDFYAALGRVGVPAREITDHDYERAALA
jgi:saccharopine dehydrogenase-like NADP-dependent oxidoreductase